MEYIMVLWIHDLENEPHILYHEINDDRYEIRKIEVYKDDSFGLATKFNSFGGTELSEVALPNIEEINSDVQFKAKVIEREVFEKEWEYYNSFLNM